MATSLRARPSGKAGTPSSLQSGTVQANGTDSSLDTHPIIARYNKHYREQMKDILYVHGKITTPTLHRMQQPTLKSIDTDSITISFKLPSLQSEIDKVIPLPLETERSGTTESITKALNQLIIDSASKRNLSLAQITTVVAPNSLQDFLVLLLTPLPALCLTWPQFVLPYIPVLGSYLMDKPDYITAIFIAEILIHALECIVLLRPQLEYFRVQPDVAIEWYLFGLLEGYGAVRRVKELGFKLEKEARAELS